MSYTTFTLDNLRVCSDEVAIGDAIIVEVDVRNTGSRAGDEVVQLYTRSELTSVTRPVQELRGFKRVSLDVGEKKTLRFTLHTHQLAFYDAAMRYVVEPGPLTVMVGTGAGHLALRRNVALVGTKREVREPILASDVQVTA